MFIKIQDSFVNLDQVTVVHLRDNQLILQLSCGHSVELPDDGSVDPIFKHLDERDNTLVLESEFSLKTP